MQKQLKTNLNGYGKNSIMNTFDTFLMYFGTIYMFYIVYVNTPFKKDIDHYFSSFVPLFKNHPIAKTIFYYLKMMHEMNEFLLINYASDEEKEENQNENKEKTNEKEIETKVELYENKYLEKFKQFCNEYVFSEEELKEKEEKCNSLRIDSENERRKHMETLLQTLEHIQDVNQKIENADLKNKLKVLMEYYDEEDDFEQWSDESDELIQMKIDEMMNDLKETENQSQKDLDELKNMDISLEHFQEEAHTFVLNKKLSTFMNNYIIESTPLGNVFMRYNHDKGSFEYFSNNTIPYRYLEPVGRKYVVTYYCKPLFVDLEEELKKSEDKMKAQQENQKKDDDESGKNVNPNTVFAKFRKYNKDVVQAPISNTKYSKNRAPESGNLPSHMKVNLPNVNNVANEKKVLKEHANRYTYEGRLSNFSILKKIDRKIIDKKYAMTFADFKRMNQNQSMGK
jgi:hypothetical protein